MHDNAAAARETPMCLALAPADHLTLGLARCRGQADIASAAVPGVKAAAVRKLKQELGIEPEQLSTDAFKFLTRLHYWWAKLPFGVHVQPLTCEEDIGGGGGFMLGRHHTLQEVVATNPHRSQKENLAAMAREGGC